MIDMANTNMRDFLFVYFHISMLTLKTYVIDECKYILWIGVCSLNGFVIFILFYWSAPFVMLILKTTVLISLQVFSAGDGSSPTVWLGEGVRAHRPPVGHLPGCQQLDQDGGRDRGLSAHRVWIQQVQVRAASLSRDVPLLLQSRPALKKRELSSFLRCLFIRGTTLKTWSWGRSTSCWSESRSNTWSCSSSRKR